MSDPLNAVEVKIRAITLADTEEVARLDAINYEFPWSLEVFKDCVAAGYYCAMLYPEPNPWPEANPLWGYGIMSFGAGEAHVLNLSVRSMVQRRGLGELMLRELMRHAKEKNAVRVFLEVRQSMQVAQRLYRRLGFKIIGERRGYYPAREGREDGWVMEHVFNSAPDDHSSEEM